MLQEDGVVSVQGARVAEGDTGRESEPPVSNEFLSGTCRERKSKKETKK